VDTEERIDAILPELDSMIGGGLITLEKVRVIVYRPESRGSGKRGAEEEG
jgi:PII-like signaling protein